MKQIQSKSGQLKNNTGGICMRTLLEEHGGAIATAAVIVIFIAAIVLLGQSNHLVEMFTNLLQSFSSQAQNAAGF